MSQNDGMRVLIIGGGILEHALAWKLKESSQISRLFVAPGNVEISKIAECVDIQENNYHQLIKFAKNERVDLTIVGPYRLVTEGIADHFADEGLCIFAPSARDAEIGASRIVAKELMRHYSILTPSYHIFANIDGALTFCENARFPLVIKIDGTALAGTTICHSMDDVVAHLDKAMKQKIFGEAGERVIVEDFIDGQIISMTILLDRKTIIPFPGCQIIRELVNNNKTPVKLGAYSAKNVVGKRMMHHIQREIIVPLVHAINRQSRAYKGFVTVDMVITSRGPRVLDFKVQWSDVLAQLLLYQYKGDFLHLLMSVLKGKPEEADMNWNTDPVVGLIVTKDMFSDKVDVEMPKIPELENDDIQIFCGKTRRFKDKILATGDRLFGIVSTGKTLELANESVYDVLQSLDLKHAFFKQYQK